MIEPEDTLPGRALRKLQVLDEMMSTDYRHLLIEAEDRLGEELGLECTGVRDDIGDKIGYKHNGGTCPIHEWLVPGDCPDEDVVRE